MENTQSEYRISEFCDKFTIEIRHEHNERYGFLWLKKRKVVVWYPVNQFGQPMYYAGELAPQFDQIALAHRQITKFQKGVKIHSSK